jgi:hypothetical protein
VTSALTTVLAKQMLVIEGDLRERLAFCRRRSDDGAFEEYGDPDRGGTVDVLLEVGIEGSKSGAAVVDTRDGDPTPAGEVFPRTFQHRPAHQCAGLVLTQKAR